MSQTLSPGFASLLDTIGFARQTAPKTQEVINKAMGRILFIDEAYSLARKQSETDFASEAIETLLKAMEDELDDLIVIAAGYPREIAEFITANPGLESRFTKHLQFEDYNADELYQILKNACNHEWLPYV